MRSRGGPTSRVGIDPAVLVAFLDGESEYVESGHPKRRRLYVHGIPIVENDARVIRRWRAGTTNSVTIKACRDLLFRYALDLTHFGEWCIANDSPPCIRGNLPSPDRKANT